MRAHRGYTLLDVFLAMLLVTLIIFAIVSLYPGVMACVRRSHDLYVGSSLNMQQLEQSRMVPFTSVVSAGPIGTSADEVFATNLTVVSLGPNLKQVTAQTSWNGTSQTSLDYVDFNFLNPVR